MPSPIHCNSTASIIFPTEFDVHVGQHTDRHPPAPNAPTSIPALRVSGFPEHHRNDGADVTQRIDHEAPHAASNAPAPNIPMEIWRAANGLSCNDDVTARLTSQWDPQARAGSTTITLTDANEATLHTLLYSDTFPPVTTLRLQNPDARSLTFLADYLINHRREDMTIELIPRHAILPSAVAQLADRALKALSLDYRDDTVDPDVLRVLVHSSTPISLKGAFTPDAFLEASNIPTLTTLAMTGRGFDDNSARWFACHPSIEVMSIGASWNFSPRGMETVARLPMLRSLRLNECSTPLVTDHIAHALAEHRGIKTLEIHCADATLSATSLEALSRSQSLETLRVPMGPQLHYLRSFSRLEHLTFHASRSGKAARCDVESASIVAGLSKLKSLELSSLTYEKNALSLLLVELRAEQLSFVGDHQFDMGDIVALSYNRRIKTLTIKDAQLSARNIAALVRHPTLQRLTIASLEFSRRPGHDTLILANDDENRLTPAPALHSKL